MLSQTINQVDRQAVERLVLTVPFYKQLQQLDNAQYELLLHHSKIMTFLSGDTVVAQGSHDQWLYCLLKGQCQVLTGDPLQSVNEVAAGEVFGDLALLMQQPRTATIVADTREIQVFATDFSIFGELNNVVVIKLHTKLCYYRNLAQNLRWKLEVYRQAHPAFMAANSHRQAAFFKGTEGSMAELEFLYQQCCEFGQLILEWNRGFSEQELTC